MKQFPWVILGVMLMALAYVHEAALWAQRKWRTYVGGPVPDVA